MARGAGLWLVVPLPLAMPLLDLLHRLADCIQTLPSPGGVMVFPIPTNLSYSL